MLNLIFKRYFHIINAFNISIRFWQRLPASIVDGDPADVLVITPYLISKFSELE
jgi:inorganic pyrophosphatase